MANNNKVICMVTMSAYPSDVRVRREAEELEKKGYVIDIISVQLEQSSKIEKFGNINAYRVQKSLPKERLIPYILYSTLFMIKAFIKLQRLYLEKKYSLIQIHNMPDHLIFVTIIQKILKVPIILDIHDLTYELFEEKWPGSRHKLIKSFVAIVEKISCSFANHIITVTEGCKEKLVLRGVPENKITLILNTPNQDVFKFQLRSNDQVIKEGARIVYPGTVAYRFGVHLIIEAMKFVKEKIPGSIFNVFGDYDSTYKSYLISKINELGLEENVKLNGDFDVYAIPKILGESDIGVVPYVESLYMHLALPTKACEFAAVGVPIVSTYLKTVASTFRGDSISYVNSGNPQEFAEKIIELCLNPELRKMRIKEAHASISNISWQIMSARYTKLIDNLAFS
jgi:glycosyltransferase involved in cell wall biosynthesis